VHTRPTAADAVAMTVLRGGEARACTRARKVLTGCRPTQASGTVGAPSKP
jgi:hypothetical protein